LVGRSAKLGWGLTSSNLDDTDVYIEQLNPLEPSEYKTPQGYKPFTTKQSIVRVKDKSPVTLEMFWTENGPVLPGSHANLGAVTPLGHVTSIASTLLSSQDTSVEAGFDLMAARSVQEGLEASRGFVAPSQILTLGR
jgi:penicillin amidase